MFEEFPLSAATGLSENEETVVSPDAMLICTYLQKPCASTTVDGELFAPPGISNPVNHGINYLFNSCRILSITAIIIIIHRSEVLAHFFETIFG